MSKRSLKSQVWLGVASFLFVLLLAAIFTLGSLNLPFELHDTNEVLILWSATVSIMVALFVFSAILGRTVVRLWNDRRADHPGSHFKTQMVLGAMAISLLPLVFMFFISYGLMNRTLNRWFPHSLEMAKADGETLVRESDQLAAARMSARAHRAAQAALDESYGSQTVTLLNGVRLAAQQGADSAWAVDARGTVISSGDPLAAPVVTPPARKLAAQLGNGAELWKSENGYYLAERAPLGTGYLVVGQRLPPDFLDRYANIQTQTAAYDAENQQIRKFKRQILLTLSLFTVVLLFAVTWCALYLAKQVTVPIQALAEATRQIAAGHFDTQVQVKAQDELSSLVHSFNDMTAQLADSQRQIDDFTHNLQQAVQELDRRRMLIETVLENIPTGVFTLDPQGTILRMNTAARQIFGAGSAGLAGALAGSVLASGGNGGGGNTAAGNGGENGHAATLADLTGGARARDIQHLIRRAQRMGTASRELQFHMRGRVVHAAVTVSPLGPRTANGGCAVVIDDLTELLRAQKLAAWQEVAQRIAHEIRNPLTPIQLSAERLSRYLERHSQDPGKPELAELVSECSALIGREVGTLEALVNEFSQFARFPVARLATADPNEIVSGALEVFHGRLGDVAIGTDLASDLPAIKADIELLRRVIVNLIDNAAEAMEGFPEKSLQLSTRFLAAHDTVEISVADSGGGISPEDKDKLFLPHFSTKERGTGLGLAIASRIVAEHHGLIRAEDNQPAGSRFVIEVPTAEALSAALAAES